MLKNSFDIQTLFNLILSLILLYECSQYYRLSFVYMSFSPFMYLLSNFTLIFHSKICFVILKQWIFTVLGDNRSSCTRMEDDWAPILQKDCLLFSSAAVPVLDDFHLTNLDSHEHLLPGHEVKTEPLEETSDYHGSSSGSPSSSLSSPDMKDHLGVDLSFCVPFPASTPFLNSPASSSGSPFGMFPPCGGGSQTSPLPPVSHFSHQIHQQEHPIAQNVSFHSHSHETVTYFDDDRSPSPPTSDRSSPMETMPSMMNIAYDVNGTHVMNGLNAAQQQLKSRSKMHEMAVKQRLITDQDPRSQGMVQLSAEERRTLIQEGYQVPTRLPLNKAEEEALKIVRRKIKNKLSAQESRRKRKEYMDTLEQRCQGYFNENAQLKGRVRQLELSNKQLVAQVKKMQEILGLPPEGAQQ